MKVNLYSQKGNKLKEEVTLNNDVFGVELNPDLISQYVRTYQANQRQGTSAVKSRGEVRGGGRKPWRQKGTGRARHGSIRSPIWVGGGTVHGPTPRDFSLKMPKNMRKKALLSALSDQANQKRMVVLKELSLEDYKTKEIHELVEKIKTQVLDKEEVQKAKVLLVLPEYDKKIVRSTKNLPKVQAIQAKELNAYAILWADLALVVKPSLEVISETFLG